MPGGTNLSVLEELRHYTQVRTLKNRETSRGFRDEGENELYRAQTMNQPQNLPARASGDRVAMCADTASGAGVLRDERSAS
jgi:hypothetical protein